jgi:ribosomal protein S18 acetylase RimI-like enzyme
LDVKVFRGFCISAKEYIQQKQDHHSSGGGGESTTKKGDMLEEEAVDVLMPNYDEYGNYVLEHASHYDSEAYFVAIYTNNDGDGSDGQETTFERTNGVVGVISAQLRHRSPFIAGCSVVKDGDSENKEVQTTNPAVPIPSPHVYLANMRVHETMQRRGIGMALLSAVREYTQSLSEGDGGDVPPMILSVDNDNSGAIQMYEKFGFEYLEKNDVFCMMGVWL